MKSAVDQKVMLFIVYLSPVTVWSKTNETVTIWSKSPMSRALFPINSMNAINE